MKRNLMRGLQIVCAVWLAGCASTPGKSSAKSGFAHWANSPSCTHRVIIAPENTTKAEARELAEKYRAAVCYDPPKGLGVDPVYWGLAHTAGSIAPKTWGQVRGLSEKLIAINDTGNHWDIYVMAGASWLFLQTLKVMPERALSNSSGIVHLIGWQKTPEIEDGLLRLSSDKFRVSYE